MNENNIHLAGHGGAWRGTARQGSFPVLLKTGINDKHSQQNDKGETPIIEQK